MHLSKCLRFNTLWWYELCYLPYLHLDIFAGLHALACSISTIFTKSPKLVIMCAFYNVLSLVLFVHVGVLEDFRIQLLELGFLGPSLDSGQNPDLSGADLLTNFTWYIITSVTLYMVVNFNCLPMYPSVFPLFYIPSIVNCLLSHFALFQRILYKSEKAIFLDVRPVTIS